MPVQPVIQSAETIVLGLALCSGALGHWVVSVATGTRYTRPVLFANCVLSGFAAAVAAYVAIHHTSLEVGAHLSALGGFGIGAVWGPTGLWRLATVVLRLAGQVGDQLGPAPAPPPALTPPPPPPGNSPVPDPASPAPPSTPPPGGSP